MKRFNACIFAGIVAFSALGQGSALDLHSRAILRQERLAPAPRATVKAMRKSPLTSSDGSVSYGFVKVASEADVMAFTAAGGEVLSRRGNILLTAMPTDKVEEIAFLPGIKRVQLARPVLPKLDRARQLTGIDKIHQGIDLPRAYTGRGVVTGIVDGGMDPNHINFKDADGNPRIKQFTYIRPNQAGTGAQISVYAPEQLPSFQTDDNASYHGTHTMGIMAGSYRGDVSLCNEKGEIVTAPCPYYGAAIDSDIAASCGQLSDMFIALGIQYIADYAYYQKKPAVINLSLGSNLGSHDGRSVMSQFLDTVSAMDNITFCISAGNEGDMNIALNKRFSAGDTLAKTFIRPVALGADDRFGQYGTIEIYSNDSTVFDTQVVVFNRTRKTIAFRASTGGNTNGVGHYTISSDKYAQDGTENISPQFAKAFEGYVGFGSMVDPDTGRFYTLVDYLTLNNQQYNATGQYALGIIVTGKDGQRVDFFTDGMYSEFSSHDVDGWLAGSPDGSISDLATAKCALIVGSYNNRDSWDSLDGNGYGYQGMFAMDDVSSFTSYGTLVDGRSLPHLCAPGATIISSTNSHFVYSADNGITPAYLQAKTDGKDQAFWEQMVGTSMASPMVAGSIALWLEADSTLTPSEIKEIAMSTCTRDAAVTGSSAPAIQWGAGKFNAHAGLLEVLRRQPASIAPVIDNAVRPVITSNGAKQLSVFFAAASGLDITLTDLTGRRVRTLQSHADEATIDCTDLASGIYIITVNNQSQKIIL